MKRKQRHSVEFCFIALCAVLFHKELSDSCGELAKVVGGKDRGAVISAGSLEGTPLERHCKEHGVKSHNRRHSGRKESQEQDRKDIDPDTDKTKICGKILWDLDRKDNSSHIYEKRTHTQKHIRKIPAYEIPHNTNKIGCLGIAKKICS